jgi:hypothetical protein
MGLCGDIGMLGHITCVALRCGIPELMSEFGLVSRVSPVQTALRNCKRDEGRSFEVGNQVLISSHCTLLTRVAENPEKRLSEYFECDEP